MYRINVRMLNYKKKYSGIKWSKYTTIHNLRHKTDKTVDTNVIDTVIHAYNHTCWYFQMTAKCSHIYIILVTRACLFTNQKYVTHRLEKWISFHIRSIEWFIIKRFRTKLKQQYCKWCVFGYLLNFINQYMSFS